MTNPVPLPRRTVKEIQTAERRIEGKAYVPAPKRRSKWRNRPTWAQVRIATLRDRGWFR